MKLEEFNNTRTQPKGDKMTEERLRELRWRFEHDEPIKDPSPVTQPRSQIPMSPEPEDATVDFMVSGQVSDPGPKAQWYTCVE